MINKKEFEQLVTDFPGGRKKENEKSQLFYDSAKAVLSNFDSRPYSEIKLFTKYLKEVAERICIESSRGIEFSTKPLQSF